MFAALRVGFLDFWSGKLWRADERQYLFELVATFIGIHRLSRPDFVLLHYIRLVHFAVDRFVRVRGEFHENGVLKRHCCHQSDDEYSNVYYIVSDRFHRIRLAVTVP